MDLAWVQDYNPLGSPWLSSVVAGLPVLLLLGLLAFGASAPRSALAGLAAALVVAVAVYRMPLAPALAAAGFGACFGLFPIGWIVFSAVFLYHLTVRSGQFEIVKRSVAAISPDQRVQALLIAFSFGAFLEGAAGFGTPVAISAALLIGLGFKPLYAAGLALLANTSPVAFGGLGTPLTVLSQVSQIDQGLLTQMAGRQLTPFSLLVPAWLVVAMSGWKGLRGSWPAVLVCGGTFAVLQFLASNVDQQSVWRVWEAFAAANPGWESMTRPLAALLATLASILYSPTLVNVFAGLGSLVTLAIFLRFWQPREIWRFPTEGPREEPAEASAAAALTWKQVAYAWVPWIILSAVVFAWGWPSWKAALDGGTPDRPNALRGISLLRLEVPALHGQVYRNAPVVQVPEGAKRAEKPEPAVYEFRWLSATGTAIFLSAVLAAFWLRIGVRAFFAQLLDTLYRVRWALATIACMLGLAYATRYSGADATLGLAFTKTGWLYPFFAPLLGWLGVALTGSDTSANALFGSLQKITAQQLELNPVLIVASNSTGGVMGKMIDAQSIVVAAVATEQPGHEGQILRWIFFHSLVLAILMGLLTLLQAYVWPWMIPG